MTDDAALGDLLSLWEQGLAQGRDVPAAELCRDRPDLAAELERHMQAIRQFNALAQPPHPGTPQQTPSVATSVTAVAPATGMTGPECTVPGCDVIPASRPRRLRADGAALRRPAEVSHRPPLTRSRKRGSCAGPPITTTEGIPPR
jgi:hypothetical protein